MEIVSLATLLAMTGMTRGRCVHVVALGDLVTMVAVVGLVAPRRRILRSSYSANH